MSLQVAPTQPECPVKVVVYLKRILHCRIVIVWWTKSRVIFYMPLQRETHLRNRSITLLTNTQAMWAHLQFVHHRSWCSSRSFLTCWTSSTAKAQQRLYWVSFMKWPICIYCNVSLQRFCLNLLCDRQNKSELYAYKHIVLQGQYLLLTTLLRVTVMKVCSAAITLRRTKNELHNTAQQLMAVMTENEALTVEVWQWQEKS